MPGKKRNTRKDPQAPGWDLGDIQELLDVLIKREVTEFEWEKGPVKIRIKRGETRANSFFPSPPHESGFAVTPSNPPQPVVDTVPPVTPAAEPTTTESKEDLFVVKSPIVGTFFASPAPNAPPFVNVGDEVHIGQVLCIVEAMKLMNEIESEVAGEIVRIYVENGQPVEYGQNLFAIRPSHKKS
ncbi:MAG: acetyl-CoA carboxylase biotin carboxyl carrier protein [Terriglobia bacterium]|jgi:acetyl-CoA carboxylase biotin carboxyl carrier protein